MPEIRKLNLEVQQRFGSRFRIGDAVRMADILIRFDVRFASAEVRDESLWKGWIDVMGADETQDSAEHMFRLNWTEVIWPASDGVTW